MRGKRAERKIRESRRGFEYEREESTLGKRETRERDKREKKAQESTTHALLTILLECHVIFERFA